MSNNTKGRERIVVSFTTIPSRIQYVQPVIDSIRSQSLSPDAIELNIPKEYRRRDFGEPDAAKFPHHCDVVICDADYGPATKVLPTVQRYSGRDDVIIVYCDDDRLYDRDWLKRLVELSRQYPDACIAEQGFNAVKRIAQINANLGESPKKTPLEKFKSLFSRRVMPAPIDIAEGFGGVLVKPDFYGEMVFDIPDVFWTVDDIWLSGCLAVAGVPIYRTRKTRGQKSQPLMEGETDVGEDMDSLKHATIAEHNRDRADLTCMKYFLENHKVWID